ncbi:MAG: heavy metal-responsive transcriptional regulator [Acidobacteriota bacterium]
MRIGEAAASAGVNIQTLRYYERRGLLKEPQRRASGYREYSENTVALIRFIKKTQSLGFTLNEIRDFIRLRETNTRNRGRVRMLATVKMAEIDRKLQQLQTMREALNDLVNAIDICTCETTQKECPLLKSLSE